MGCGRRRVLFDRSPDGAQRNPGMGDRIPRMPVLRTFIRATIAMLGRGELCGGDRPGGQGTDLKSVPEGWVSS